MTSDEEEEFDEPRPLHQQHHDADELAPDLVALLQGAWGVVRATARQRSAAVCALLYAVWPLAVTWDGTVTLEVGFRFHLDKLAEPASHDILEWAIEQVLECPVRVELVPAATIDADRHDAPAPAAQSDPDAPWPAAGDTAAHRRLAFARWLYERGLLREDLESRPPLPRRAPPRLPRPRRRPGQTASAGGLAPPARRET